jgi:hypothetical protein
LGNETGDHSIPDINMLVQPRILIWTQPDHPLFNMSDLLYYDHIAVPGTLTAMTNWLLFESPHDPYPKLPELVDRLIDKGLLFEFGLFSTALNDKPLPTIRENEVRNIARQAFMGGGGARSIANRLTSAGIQTTVRHTTNSFAQEFKTGDVQTLAVQYSALPSIDLKFLGPEAFVSFLVNSKTKRKRRHKMTGINERKGQPCEWPFHLVS